MHSIIFKYFIVSKTVCQGIDKMKKKNSETRWRKCIAMLLALPIFMAAFLADACPTRAAGSIEDIVLKAEDYDAKQSSGAVLDPNIDGRDTTAVVTEDESRVVWHFSAEEPGSFYIKLRYYTVSDSSLSMERRLTIDDKESVKYSFRRSYSRTGEATYDLQGNEIRGAEKEDLCWQEVWLTDPNGYEQEETVVSLEAGDHTLVLDSLLGRMAIGSVTLTRQKPSVKSYEEVLKAWKNAGADDGKMDLKKVQAEKYLHKSDASILLLNDRSSAATEPSSAKTIVYNTIGGSSWSENGQWVEWEIEVPKDGFYQLGLRWRQNSKAGGMSSRRLTIDGEVPFAEAEQISFAYDNSWKVSALGGKTPWRFYLTKGTHTIRLMVNQGDMGLALAETSALLETLNEMYMKIIMVSGTSPDLKRDYNFTALIPDVIEQYNSVAKEIDDLIDKVDKMTDGSQGTAELSQMRDVLKWMYEDPETTAKRLSDFSSNTSALASWLSDCQKQPLEVDYLFVSAPGVKLPKAGAGFFSNLRFQFAQLVNSFFMDYTSVGNTNPASKDEKALKVWVIAGTEQAQVIQSLINEQFIPNSSIPVKLENVTTGALMPAIFAGRGPDVVLNLDEATPVNYALRGVLKDLREYKDIDEVLSWYEPCSYEAFALDGGLYALPTTLDYPVLFYRKDILEEMGISLEECKTWDTMLQAVLPKLQMKNLRFGLTPSLNSFLMFYYQGGNNLYNQDCTRILLDTKEAFSAFTDYSSIYTDYRQDRSFDFVNLFRSGEMPIAVVNYSQYYQLAVFAPEIEEKWGVMLAPGTRKDSGEIDHTVACTVSGASILKGTKAEKEAWEFLKWWAGNETQADYAREVETKLGIAGRVNPAANEARVSIPWSREVQEVLKEQLGYCRGVPQVPGSYYVGRYFDFGFRDVTNNGDDIVQTLISITEDINAEIWEKTLELKKR